MKAKIAVRLREYWDAGIRGPDFVWAATGPALEAYSKHPVVRKANEPNATMGVGEFLNHVRRMVVDYIVGQVLSGERGSDLAAADRLDEVTAYYLLHRHDFGMDEAPVGACILYATACGLSDTDLDRTWDILSHAGGNSTEEDEGKDQAAESEDFDSDGDAEPAEESASGSKVKLKPWNQRRGKNMGYEAPEGRVVPLIDRIHRVLDLWTQGEAQKVDEYLDQHALRRNELFKRVVQSLIELARDQKQEHECRLLESISNHIGAKGVRADVNQRDLQEDYVRAGHSADERSE
jgi:putative DNA methylase